MNRGTLLINLFFYACHGMFLDGFCPAWGKCNDLWVTTMVIYVTSMIQSVIKDTNPRAVFRKDNFLLIKISLATSVWCCRSSWLCGQMPCSVWSLTLSLFLVSCSVWPPSLLEAAFFLCYSSTALAGGYSCVTLTLTLSNTHVLYLTTGSQSTAKRELME